jgi:hypothetical protein
LKNSHLGLKGVVLIIEIDFEVGKKPPKFNFADLDYELYT